MLNISPTLKAIRIAGGCSGLGRELGISQAAVARWKSQDRIPIERVLEVERLTGIPRHQLRPDIYPPSDA